jgi:outer membrane protein
MHSLRTTLAVLFAGATAAFGQNAAQPRQLSLPEAVAKAIEHNPTLRIQRFEPQIESAAVDIQKSAFDLQSTASTSAGKTKDPYYGTTEASATSSVGVTKKTSTGATVGLETTLTHDNEYTPTDDTGVYLTFTQPLLKGAWADVNLAELRKARSAFTVAQLQTRSDTLDLVLTVSDKYWDLAYARANVELKKSAVAADERLVEETQAKVNAHLATPMDLLQSRSTLSSKREALTQAEMDLAAAGDELGVQMGLLLDDKGTAFLPTVAELPVDAQHAAPFDTEWTRILNEDIDSMMQAETIDQADIDLLVAKNNRRPQLDVTLKAGYAGADYNERDAYQSLADRDGKSWNGAVAFSMPIGNREYIAKYRQTRAALEQAKIKLISIKQALYQKARLAWRDVELDVERCASTQAAVEYQTQALQMARVKYSNGLISFRELLDAQTDYDTAQVDRIDALRDLAEARTQLARLDGSLPQTLQLSTTSIPSVDKGNSK